MIYDTKTIQEDFLIPMIKTIIRLPDATTNEKAHAIAESFVQILEQDREAHARTQ